MLQVPYNVTGFQIEKNKIWICFC